VAFASMNVVGGYVVTGRMLKMFKRRVVAAPAAPAVEGSQNGQAAARAGDLA
jgi:NAD/NADP transhydrogenase alpha subunit